MKISIVIPVYNVERYLANLLDSILKQTYNDFEVILVDDGSKDNSYKIMEDYSKEDNRIKIFKQKNSGPGIARKNGYMHAKGDLLFFVDSDDQLYDDKVLEKINEIFMNNNIDLLLFESKRNPDDGKRNRVIEKGNIEKGIHSISELDECVVEGCLWMKILKKEKFKEDFFIDANNFEDGYTTYKYLNECNYFYYLDEPLYIVNRLDENNSLTKTFSFEKAIRTVDIIIQINQFSKLKKSVELLALIYYMTYVRKIFTIKGNLEKKRELCKKLQQLGRILDNDAKKLCKEKFKRKAYYLYRVSRIFI